MTNRIVDIIETLLAIVVFISWIVIGITVIQHASQVHHNDPQSAANVR